jgi:hypothetical protein
LLTKRRVGDNHDWNVRDAHALILL